MRLGKETKEIFYRYETEMTEEEFIILRNYADDNIGKEELDDLLINWAVVDILKKQLEKEIPCLEKKLKKKNTKKKSQKKKLKSTIT